MAKLEINYDRFRPKVCAFFAGRAWYAGMPTGEKLGWVLFSQVLDDIGDIDKCYQENDPTSEIFSDLLDDDGGVIQIPDAGEIVGLVALSKSLFVFGSNGVWQIIGGGDNGFTASTYSVEKVTAVGCFFQKSIVQVEDSIFYWSNSGIYVLSVQAGGFTSTVKNISDDVIKTLYQSIPTINKIYVDGKYNETDKIVHWLYSDVKFTDSSTGKYKKNKVLGYNLKLGAFYTYSLETDVGPIVTALCVTKETVETEVEYDVVVNDEEVYAGLSNVVSNITVVSGSRKEFKYYTLYTTSMSSYAVTWSDMLGTRFADWYKYNTAGSESPAYVVTGYNMGGVGPARNKTAQYVHMFMQRTETEFDAEGEPLFPSSCLMQTKWDFTDSSVANKWSSDVQVYRQLRPYYSEPNTTFDDGYPLVITKNKIRGRGKALQIKLSSEESKDMRIMGWSINFVGNSNV